jgi:uncharacterized membrane protein YccF (DUF307 family)
VASRRLAFFGEVRVSKIECLTEVATGEVSQLTQILWFVALGILLLRAGRREASTYLREE